MAFRAPIGISDFRKLREAGASYVDKTRFIEDVLLEPGEALLFPRPRRFGKTLNLSALRAFVEKSDEDASPLFADLSVWQSPEARAHFQRYPVLFLTFKDIKQSSWADCLAKLGELIAAEVRRHRLAGSVALDAEEHKQVERLGRGEASRVELEGALGALSGYLSRTHAQKVIILIDEYDTPIHAGYANGYYDEVIAFFRNFLSGGFKDNPYLFKGVLTGILRVAKESIFSGLNNLSVHSILSREFATSFGFTEEEVQRIAVAEGLGDKLEDIRRAYNGYLFGGQVIYNPWSVLNYFARPEDGLGPYWVATGSNEIIRDLLLASDASVRADVEALLRGEEIEKPIDDSIVLRDLPQHAGVIWSFLLFSGYLKATRTFLDTEGTRFCRLAIPNLEVRSTYGSVFRNWLDRALGGGDGVRALTRALLSGDAASFERLLEEMIVNALSFHDLGGPAPERVYQAFIVGLLVHLGPEYVVRSNRESGFGRYDVLVMPREAGRPGVVLELKVLDARRGETSEQALQSAIGQLERMDYAAELRAAGASPIHELAAVFDGKRAWVRALSR